MRGIAQNNGRLINQAGIRIEGQLIMKTGSVHRIYEIRGVAHHDIHHAPPLDVD